MREPQEAMGIQSKGMALEIDRLRLSPAPLTFAAYSALSLPQFPPLFGGASHLPCRRLVTVAHDGICQTHGTVPRFLALSEKIHF